MVKLSYMAAVPVYPPAKRSTILLIVTNSNNLQQPDWLFFSRKNKKTWLPPLGYSPQFAAFNQILLAVGHRVLQHFYVLMVDNRVTRSHFICQKRGTKPNDT